MSTFGAFLFVPLEMMIRSISCDVIASVRSDDHIKRRIKTELELMESMTKRGSIRVKVSNDSHFSGIRDRSASSMICTPCPQVDLEIASIYQSFSTSSTRAPTAHRTRIACSLSIDPQSISSPCTTSACKTSSNTSTTSSC